VAQSVISAYERGRREPSLATLSRLVSATGLSLDIDLRAPDQAKVPLGGPLGRRVLENSQEIKRLVEADGFRNARLFGSVARGQEHDRSDVDMLVDVPSTKGLFDLWRLETKLSELLGVAVDLIPADGLKADLIDEVTAEAVAL
jgi:predicted nucleotidyltransferase